MLLMLLSESTPICKLSVDIDYTFYKMYYQYGRTEVNNLINKAIKIVNRQLENIIEIQLKNITLLNQYNRVKGGLSNLLLHYNNTLHTLARHSTQDNCINLLLVHRSYAELDMYGIAYLGMGADNRYSGGICKPYYNTITINIIQYNQEVLIRTIIHEIGHSLGAKHDCCYNDLCTIQNFNNCYIPSNPYVMNRLITKGSNSLLFSEISLKYMSSVIPFQNSCLT